MRYRQVLRIGALILVGALARQVCGAQNRGPSTPEERAKAVEITRMLETDPLNKEAKEARRWMTLWLIQVPDISVSVCTHFLEPLAGAKDNYAPEIFNQMMFSGAAFAIENPDKAKDPLAMYTAGLEGSLKTYQAILKSKPKAKWPFLDELVEKRDREQLVQFVQATIPKCSRGAAVVPK